MNQIADPCDKNLETSQNLKHHNGPLTQGDLIESVS